MKPVIVVQNLTKIYPLPKAVNGQKTFEAVKAISFEVQKGEIFGILGPNGAGKTTTLEIIECLIQQTSGSVDVLGFNNLESGDDIKKRIGIQLQSSQYLHHLTLGELLDLFGSLYQRREAEPLPLTRGSTSRSEGRGLEKNQLTPTTPSATQPPLLDPTSHKASSDLRKEGNAPQYSFDSWIDTKKSLLELVGLLEKEHSEVKDLSGGQRQRFTIATALVHTPEILFLDEPTTGLDPKARHDLWQLIKTLNNQGITIVMTTHFMDEAEFLCHRVAIMDSGKILEIDEPKKLIDRLSDTIQISFFTEKQIDQSIFSVMPEIKKAHADFPKVVLEINSLDKISAIVTLLKTHNIVFYGFTVKTATLEDVYLQLTGREYQE